MVGLLFVCCGGELLHVQFGPVLYLMTDRMMQELKVLPQYGPIMMTPTTL